MVKKKLFVGNLPNNYDSQKLRDSFEQFGTVAECDVLRNYGFVHMENEMEAEAAVRGLHHTMIDDCQINVQYSTTEVHKNPGVGSKGECFRCGKTGHFSRECPTNANGGGRPRGRGRGRGRGGGGGRGDSYSNGRDFYPSPMRDGYYEFDDYYRRPLPPPGYGYRERSRSPPMRRPVTPPGYRRRYSPTREYYDRYYERIPSRDPYYSYERRLSPVPTSYRRPPPPEDFRRPPPEEYRRPVEEFRERAPLPRDLEYYSRMEGKRPAARTFEERELNRMPADNSSHFIQQSNMGPINFAEDVNF